MSDTESVAGSLRQKDAQNEVRSSPDFISASRLLHEKCSRRASLSCKEPRWTHKDRQS